MSIHLDLKSLIANMLAQHMKKIVLKYQPQKLKKLLIGFPRFSNFLFVE